MERADVAIVGGGPAGSSAARTAAAAGADAVLFESGVPRADRDRLGPDSTDAAGMLDYWTDIADLDVDALPEGVVLRELTGADFVGPTESVALDSTGVESSYDGFGFTFQRARMDDWLRDRAERAGADYRVGTGVRTVTSEVAGDGPRHVLHCQDGTDLGADHLVLADGPQRRVTMGVLDQFLPDAAASERLSPTDANHIAYQEYRRFPPELFEETRLKFWWGWIPGETAYPWVFPNDGAVARVGLTMPIGMDRDDFDADDYRLLRAGDEQIPQGRVYVRRLLEEVYGDEYDLSDFPVVEDRGKSAGTETYPISSTNPIDSPTAAGVAVTGGAMGATSKFHEGGSHVAMRTGAIAGRLAAEGRLEAYNDAWKDAIGDEILRNVAMADVVADYEPADWDRAFRVAREMMASAEDGKLLTRRNARNAAGGLRLYTAYKRAKLRNRKGRYVQIRESEYQL